MPQLVGARKAAEWLLLGRPFDAREAYEAGLLNAITAPSAALVTAQATASALAAQPPAALRLSKSMLKRAGRKATQETLDYEAQHFEARLRSPEAQAAFKRFFAKST
jgi:enoyl-CoA hydratase/carnithine racemase